MIWFGEWFARWDWIVACSADWSWGYAAAIWASGVAGMFSGRADPATWMPTRWSDESPISVAVGVVEGNVKTFACGPPVGPAPVMISAFPSPVRSAAETRTPPRNDGS